jgi:hypothetical protein
MSNTDINQRDHYGNAIADWMEYPSAPQTPFDVVATLLPEPSKNRQGATVGHELVILIQSEEDYQYDVVSKLALSGAIHVELSPTAPNGEYGILQIIGDGAVLNLLCHLRTYSFAYFAFSCVKDGKLVVKIRDEDGPFIPHVIELGGKNTALTDTLTAVARFVGESTSETPIDCFGARRNFDFYCKAIPVLAQPGGGYVTNTLDTVKTLQPGWLNECTSTLDSLAEKQNSSPHTSVCEPRQIRAGGELI